MTVVRRYRMFDRWRAHVEFGAEKLADGFWTPEGLTLPIGVWRELGEPETVTVTVAAA